MIAWSFSLLTQYRQCPKQYQEVRIFKNYPDLNTKERDWGNDVHKAIQNALTLNTPLPAGMDVWTGIVEQFRQTKGKLYVEQQYAITEGFQPCDWFDPRGKPKQVWCRSIVDALWIDGKVAKAVDWKTGKQKPGSDQLALMAGVIFCHYPEVEEVRTMFVWLKNGGVTRDTFRRSDIPRIWQMFLTDVKRLENAHETGTFPAKTSGLCSQWCPVVTCQFNGKRRQW